MRERPGRRWGDDLKTLAGTTWMRTAKDKGKWCTLLWRPMSQVDLSLMRLLINLKKINSKRRINYICKRKLWHVWYIRFVSKGFVIILLSSGLIYQKLNFWTLMNLESVNKSLCLIPGLRLNRLSCWCSNTC